MKQAKQQTQDTAPAMQFFVLTQDGETLRFEGNEIICREDWESSLEGDETETFFDWCKNSYPHTPEQAEGLIRSGMKVRHSAIKEVLTVVADEKGPAYTGEEFKDNEISLSHAITEYKNGNLTIEQAEGFTGGELVQGTTSKLQNGIFEAILQDGDLNIFISHPVKKVAEANAALIGQAKNMYYALKDAIEWIEDLGGKDGIGKISKFKSILQKANPIKQ